jgi:hypothetical protein
MAIINPTAEKESFRHQRYKGEVLPPPDTDIVAQVCNQDKYTLIYFPPSQLEKVQAKWGKENLIFLKNAPKKRRKTS